MRIAAAPTALLLGLALLPATAAAHSFGRVYNLPVPLALYQAGAAGALLLSFVVLARFVAGAAALPAVQAAGDAAFGATRASTTLWRIGGALGVLGLAFIVATGLFGHANPFRNVSMTAFWVVFALGGCYAAALFGDWYAAVNPWSALLHALPFTQHGRRAWRFAYWPALALYVGLIALELFGHGSPRGLALALLGYTALGIGAAALYGRDAWLRHGEFFAVFFRLVAQMAPLQWSPRNAAGRAPLRPRLRSPVAALRELRVTEPSLLLFILFMLSSTAVDGLKETVAWNRVYWEGLAPTIAPAFGPNVSQAYPALASVQTLLNALLLVASPLPYLAVILAFLAVARRVEQGDEPLLAMALRLAPALIPLAVAYHAAHYFTLLWTQGPELLALLADPFGRAAPRPLRVAPPSAAVVWHAQVALILLGHVLSAAVCHVEAMAHAARGGGSRMRAVLAQLPLLALMVALTSFGLWVIAQPISPSRPF
jgi:hypothetical protein